MMHICVVITARASYARVQTVLEALAGRCKLTVVCAGSAVLPKFGRVAPEARELCPYEVVELPSCEPHGLAGAAMYTGQLTQQLGAFFDYARPDTVVVIADRYETLAVSIAASYQGIRLCHLLGGEESGNIDDRVRYANTALADVHCVATEQAKRRLCYVIPDDMIHATGCPSVDLALRAEPPTLDQLNATGTGALAEPDVRRIVVMYHPTAADPEGTDLVIALAVNTIAYKTDAQVFWFWPNADPGHEVIEKHLRDETFGGITWRFYRHLPSEQFLGLLKTAALLVGNSSVGVRESSAIGIPVVDVGYRQVGRTCGPNVVRRLATSVLNTAITMQLQHGPYEPSTLYGDGKAGARVAEVLLDA